MTDSKPSTEQYEYAVALRKIGLSNAGILRELIAKGMDKQAAQQLVSTVQSVRSHAEEKRVLGNQIGKQYMLKGGAVFLVGCILTILGYSATAPGGTYIVFSGVIIFGGIQFLKGLSWYLGRY